MYSFKKNKNNNHDDDDELSNLKANGVKIKLIHLYYC